MKERAESAEAELERVVTDYNEAQESSSESSTAGKSPTPSTVSALSGVSVGSDDVFDGSLFEKAQVVTEWEVTPWHAGLRPFTSALTPCCEGKLLFNALHFRYGGRQIERSPGQP